MNIGCNLSLYNDNNKSDFLLYEDFLKIAVKVEDLGFDSIWTVEHHFSGHSPVPNGITLLSYLAGATKKIILGTSVIVLPWHNPIRVIEEMFMLDILSKGRVIFGFGRGTSRLEYDGFGINMEESRLRFKEIIEIIKKSILNETIQYEGLYYKIPLLSIRPRPFSMNLIDKLYAAAESPESVAIMADLGLGLFMTPKFDKIKEQSEVVKNYNHLMIQKHNNFSSPILRAYICINENHEKAVENAKKYSEKMFDILDIHYQFSKNNLKGVKSYEYFANSVVPYGDDVDLKNNALSNFSKNHIIGNPEECVKQIKKLYDATHMDHLILDFCYAGMDIEDCIESMKLFSEKVLPILKDEEKFS
ncbi:LLM class flavin-dependent oxidoreductase [Flavobacterium daejeonense]|uniref:LLM class flavin-dependent oxidoreductase n=1 Tax=Flavobacterium daejeonense TaxID=350893 RepID=UPI000479D6AF|nr:LLM class flavin-dependent oxidoreductase [Flavobacterium daejeonense]